MSFLFEYQRDAVKKMKNGCVLCGKVGSGKSRTGLTYYYCCECGGVVDGLKKGYKQDIVPMRTPKSLYIITTARKRDTHEWEEELKPFMLSIEQQVLDTTYAGRMSIVIDSWNNIKKYAEVKNAFFLFDEQRVVGYGMWTKAFLKIAKSNHWILLSATPGDTWLDYMPVFIANGFYKNKTEFITRHVVMSYHGSYPKLERYLDQGILQSHRNDILIEMDYQNDHQTHKETLIAEYDKALYKTVLKDRWDPYENKPIENASALCFLLRKICNSDSSRIELIRSLQQKHPRIIIFYNYNHELDLLRETDFRVPTAEWNGQKHEPIPDSDEWLYFVQYNSGSEGWNCTKTNAIIFYSQNYSYKLMTQAAGRIDRLTSPYKDLYYYYIRSNSSIDFAINKALSKKKNFNESSFTDF